MKRAVVIGCSKYNPGSGWATLSSVRDTVEDLCGALIGYCGYESRGVELLIDPTSDEISTAVGSATAEPSDQMLFYYCGHADRFSDRLHLATASAQAGRDKLHTLFDYETVRLNLEHCLALGKTHSLVSVLDCCMAGTAAGFDAPWQSSRFRLTGGAVLMSTSPTGASFAPDDQRYTAFSGELIRLILEGDSSFTSPVRWSDTYPLLKQAVPETRAIFTDDGASIELTGKNRRHRPIRGRGAFQGIAKPVLGGAATGVVVSRWDEIAEFCGELIEDNLG